MKNNLALRIATAIAFAALAGGCDKLGGTKEILQPEVPSEQQLRKISYLSSADTGPQGRRAYDHFEQAKTCGDFELALRWNRPPNIAGGKFSKQMVYLTDGVPADLPKESEVFITGTIVKGDPLVAGGEVWILRMKDGSVVQAAEMADFLQKQEQQTQGDKQVALSQPNKPGRVLCAQAIYQGVAGKDPENRDKKVPLFSLLYAMDREK